MRRRRFTDDGVQRVWLSVAKVSYTDDGLEAILFTAEGDMRQALNNLQATYQGFAHISAENVFKV